MNQETGPAPGAERTSQQSAQPCGQPGCVCGGRGPMLSQMMRMMMPSDAAGEHFRNASVEFMKGMRELLDQRIQTMSQGQTKGTKMSVD